MFIRFTRVVTLFALTALCSFSVFSQESSEEKKEIKEVAKKKKKKKKKHDPTGVAPSTKFDLSDWSLSVPTDTNENGRADHIYENDLNDGYHSEYFFLSEDGGMVFKCPIKGYKTSKNTSYTRTELREMLRAGNKKIKTKGTTPNNWVFKKSPDVEKVGNYDGYLKATLAVNKVTTSGDVKQVGRVIIGQIHAEDDEPLRLYYRKLPGNRKGSIYFAHEGRGNGEEDFYELIGSRDKYASDPIDGIALNEKFTYEVIVAGDILSVKIIRPGKPDKHKVISMAKSGYSVPGEYMYFKAGVYNQNKTGKPTDYTMATFYAIENSHSHPETETTTAE